MCVQIKLVFPNYAKKYDSKNRLRPLGSAIARTITRTRRHIIKKAQCEKRSFSFFAIPNPYEPFFPARLLQTSRLRVVPHFSSGMVERAKRERALKIKSPHARKGDTRRGDFFSPGVIFTGARISLALLSLRKNGGLLVV